MAYEKPKSVKSCKRLAWAQKFSNPVAVSEPIPLVKRPNETFLEGENSKKLRLVHEIIDRGNVSVSQTTVDST